MSLKSIIQITCPECRKEFDFEKWDSINSELNPEMKDKVLDFSLYNGKCPHCGKEDRFIFPLLYNDMSHNAMIYSCDEDEVNKIKKEIRKIKQFDNKFASDEKFRIVTNAFYLSEKIRIFDAGYDDRVIELLKVSLKSAILSDHPEIQNIDVIFAELENDEKDKKLGFLVINEKNELVFSVLLDNLKDKYDFFSSILPEDNNCSIINESWAIHIYKQLINIPADKEKNVYLFRRFPKKTIYVPAGDERKIQRKERVKITIESGDETDLKEGDLALVFFIMGPAGALSSIGRVLGPVRTVQKIDDPAEIKVVDILVDFYFDIFYLPPYDKHYLNSHITNLDFTNGPVCEKMKLTDVEPLIKDFVCQFIAQNNPSEKLSYCKKLDHRQLMTTYVDQFCPDLKKTIFEKNGITSDDMSLTYDAEKVKDHPMFSIEQESLESLLVPVKTVADEPKTAKLLIPEDEELCVNGNELVLPGRFSEMLHTPGETSDTKVFSKLTEGSMDTIKLKPIKKMELLFMDDVEKLIRDIRLWLHDEKKQGLIEANVGKTVSGVPYSYYIIKELQEPFGVIYYLKFHLGFGKPVSISGHFDEKGLTGSRDTFVSALLLKEGSIEMSGKNIKGWVRDPYDSRVKKGALMNLSEESKYDELFPLHPLSECRRFVSFIIENN